MSEHPKHWHILIINGPNLNLLGTREPDIYGSMTLLELNQYIQKFITKIELEARFFQSNHEGRLIDFIHENRNWAHGLVINPGALTHYSYALRDAISGVALPAVEVHLSDIHQREAFRKISVIEPVCIEQLSGLGKESYIQGIKHLISHFETASS